MKKFSLFNHEQIIKNTYVVTENYSADKRFTIGVIVGAERALVIDTGFGMAGDLREYIESFVGTDMPMFCICTHGHSDVIGAASQFDEAYLKKEDVGAFPESVDPEQRITQLGAFTKNDPEMMEYGKSVMLDTSKTVFKDLKDGDHFHLGGVHVGIIEIPGHTPGSIAVRVTREGVTTTTFAGDALSVGMNHLTRMDRKGLIEYGQRIDQMMDFLNEDEPIYGTHCQVPMTPAGGRAIAKACYDVAHGKIDGNPSYRFPFWKGDKQPDFRIHFTGNYYIVYNADLL
ncbi:MAG: MBL fold metallo-hydrolase [Clostridiales bacterium]|nr:MBL fold metallo-hydrolase [Clostridiales bacterium]